MNKTSSEIKVKQTNFKLKQVILEEMVSFNGQSLLQGEQSSREYIEDSSARRLSSVVAPFGNWPELPQQLLYKRVWRVVRHRHISTCISSTVSGAPHFTTLALETEMQYIIQYTIYKLNYFVWYTYKGLLRRLIIFTPKKIEVLLNFEVKSIYNYNKITIIKKL